MGTYKEFFGLKDETGQEYKLIISDFVKNHFQIVPRKKKLPKNRKEIKEFMTKWAEWWIGTKEVMHNYGIEEFLNDYED